MAGRVGGRQDSADRPADQSTRVEVIGVVENAFFNGRGGEGQPRYVFFPAAERPAPPGESTFYIRHSGGLDALAPAVARALREADSRIPIASLRSFDSEVAAEVAPIWILTTLLTLFAAGSLIIAAIGQYAVVAFDGRRRTREFGLRIALGASSQQLITAVMAESFRLTAIGIVGRIRAERRGRHAPGARPVRDHADRPADLSRRVRADGGGVAAGVLSAGAPRRADRSAGRAEDGVRGSERGLTPPGSERGLTPRGRSGV